MAIPRSPENPGDETDQKHAVAHQHEYANDPQSNNLPLTCRRVSEQKQCSDTDCDAATAAEEVNRRPSLHHPPIEPAD
jgi:hypothetical protein